MGASLLLACCAEYEKDVDLERLAADLVIEGADTCARTCSTGSITPARRDRHFSPRRRSIPPV